MKPILKTWFAICLSIANIVTLYGQNNTSVSVVIKSELMKMDGKLYVFLTDAKGAPYMNKDITATAKIKGLAGKNKTVTLSTFGENAFVFNDAVGEFKNIKINFHVKNNPGYTLITATFDGKGTSGDVYECPMHPGEMMKSPGTCSKCGMGLTAKKVTLYLPQVSKPKGN